MNIIIQMKFILKQLKASFLQTMTDMKSRTIYLIIILFLASTNIATIISVNAGKKDSNEEEVAPGRQPRESRMSFFWGELGLDEEQKTEAIKYNSDYNIRAGRITGELSDLRHGIVEEMSAPRPDKEKLDSIIEEFGDRHSELKRETVNFYYQLYSVCDSNQRSRLEFMFRDMLDPEGVIYGRGRGGHGRGRQYLDRGPGRGRGRGRTGF
jgi:hypothetical protein